MNPKLIPPGNKRLKLKCDKLLSTSGFKLKLRRYTLEKSAEHLKFGAEKGKKNDAGGSGGAAAAGGGAFRFGAADGGTVTPEKSAEHLKVGAEKVKLSDAGSGGAAAGAGGAFRFGAAGWVGPPAVWGNTGAAAATAAGGATAGAAETGGGGGGGWGLHLFTSQLNLSRF